MLMKIEKKLMPDDNTNANAKMVAAMLAAGSLGGLGGHTIGSTDETVVNASTIHSCIEFSKHARSHERSDCEREKIHLKMDCQK